MPKIAGVTKECHIVYITCTVGWLHKRKHLVKNALGHYAVPVPQFHVALRAFFYILSIVNSQISAQNTAFSSLSK